MENNYLAIAKSNAFLGKEKSIPFDKQKEIFYNHFAKELKKLKIT